MENKDVMVIKEEFINALKLCGIKNGQNIMVHTSLKNIGYVCGGAQTIIEGLIETVGNEGTIIMPTQSWKNLDPSTGVHYEVSEKYWQAIRDNWPAYNKDITPTNTMGAVAEMFRKWPGALRSDHPARSVAAYGKNAKFITENHELSNIFGENSPVDKLYKLDGYVLLIGVGYDKNTSIHLADEKANYKSKRKVKESSAIMVNGVREWVTYETLYVDGEDFVDIGKAFEERHNVKKVPLGNTELVFMKQRELVDFAVEWIEKNR
ncbi:MAG: AAC(3) family N-acetyltransferase [Clostridiales bacterium]|nr:AAC(3) family N-acetyltransferase [Clostridiales bacterium]